MSFVDLRQMAIAAIELEISISMTAWAMARNNQDLKKGAIAGVVVALALSLATLLLPAEYGGYNPWTDPHLAMHNITAIIVRFAVFALIGAAFGVGRHRTLRKRQ